LLAELGTDMSVFPTAGQAASWAGLCPGNSESAGKRLSGRTRKGDRYLRRTLVQSAWAVIRKKDCFLTALFYRLAQRRGMKKAAVAVAHRILILAYYVIRDGVEYHEVGGDYFDRQNPQRTVERLVRRMERIGYQVQIVASPSADEAPAKRGRGRPCHCAARGIPCVHGRKAASVSPETTVRPRRVEPKPTARSGPPATKAQCPQCAGWGIPCLHARNNKTSTNYSDPPTESKA